MASFRGHFTFGSLVGIAAVVGAFFYAIATDPVLLGVLFIAVIVGAFLPDIDSDSSLPFYLTFGIFTAVATGGGIYYVLLTKPATLIMTIGIPPGVAIFMWFVVGTTIKKITHHRGMFHSLPAAGIFALLAILAAHALGAREYAAVLIGAAMFLGVLSHLVLDEIYAATNFHGKLFKPNHFLGSALKLFSHSKRVTLIAYLILFILLAHAWPIISRHPITFWKGF